MEHEVRETGGRNVVALRGDVDLQSSPAARKVLLASVDKGAVLVDLSGVTYLDSSGVASLVEAFQAARRKGSGFALVAVSPPARRVIELARLDRVFPIHETVEDGLGDGGA